MERGSQILSSETREICRTCSCAAPNDGYRQLCDSGLDFIDLGGTLDQGNTGFFCETAAALCCVDFFLTSDNALAHLAGALGVPTLLVLGEVREDMQRFGLDPEWTPLYETVRVVRVREMGWLGAYNAVCGAIVGALQTRHRGNGSDGPGVARGADRPV